MLKIQNIINEFESMKGLHLVEVCKHFNTSCNCDWCAFIIQQLFKENTNIELSRSCTATRSILKSRDDFTEIKSIVNAKVGDIILYDWDDSGDCDHIGMIYKISGDNIYTIEGNVNDDNFRNSIIDIKLMNEYRRSKVSNIFRYLESESESYTIEPVIIMSKCDLYNGVKSDKVVAQMLLNVLGYYNGLIDGIFGNKTLEAIKNFQKNHGLNVTGIIDSDTWVEMFQTL